MTTLVHPATPTEIEQSLIELREGAKRWVALRTAAKAELLIAVRQSVYNQASRWAQAATEAKGLTGTPLAGEEWVSGPWALLYALNRYIRTMHDLARDGAPRVDPSRVHERADGQVTVDVFPNAFYDRLLLSGVRAQVWMQPGVTRENLKSTTAVWYKQSAPQPRVALVLGAGNIASIPPLDVLYKLIADGAVCILKMNPVNEYLGPIFEDALKPLVDGGFLRFAYGDAEIGKLLCNHPLVDEIHITGSDRTFNAIVASGVTKPITAELGNVSPTIVVPGPWTDADFRFQAEQIVTQKLHNDGFNCIASQVAVLPRDWDGTPNSSPRSKQSCATCSIAPPIILEQVNAANASRPDMRRSATDAAIKVTRRARSFVSMRAAKIPTSKSKLLRACSPLRRCPAILQPSCATR